MGQIVLFTLDKGTTVFVRKEGQKQWEEFITKKVNVFTNKDLILFIKFNIKNYIVFKKNNWLLSVNLEKVKEENFIEE